MGKSDIRMNSLYRRTRDSTFAKLLLNINRAILKRVFSTMQWLKTSSPFWPGNGSEAE